MTAVATALLPAAPAAAEAPPSSPLEQVQAYVQPAVVYQQLTWSGRAYDGTNKQYFRDEPFTVSYQCTGFVINPDGYVATAGHCVDFADGVRAQFLEQVAEWAYETEYYKVRPPLATIRTFADAWRIDGENANGRADLSVNVAYGVSVSGEPTGKALPARVVGVRGFEQGDVAVLKIDEQNLTTVPLSDNQSTGVGTQVVSVGYPSSVDLVTDNSFNPSFKEGSISAEKTTSGGLYKVYEISAAVSPGMSGGPTSGLDGRIVGVNSFRISGETQPFNFVQPAQTLEELLRSEGISNSSGEVTDLYRAGLAAYFAGDKARAVESFERVLDIVPSHQFAQDYLRKSESLSGGGFFGLSLPLLIGILAALAVGVVVVVALVQLSRRRKPSSAVAAEQPPTAPTEPLYSAPGGRPTAAVATTAPPATARHNEALPPPPGPAAEQDMPAPPPPTPEPAEAESAAVAVDDDVELFCPHCGKRHEPHDQFCPHCGHHLRS